MAPESIILKLRPASTSAVDIAAALALANTAYTDQTTSIGWLKSVRDDALLDADPATLKKAEQALADAREQGERITAVRANLQQRHAAAQQAEALAGVADLKAKTEAARAELTAWWLTQRKKLAAEFARGVALSKAASDFYYSHNYARMAVLERYPGQELPEPTSQDVDASSWAEELGTSLRWLDNGSRDPVKDAQDIGRLCDPRPPGTF